jgi:hypothetical protein
MIQVSIEIGYAPLKSALNSKEHEGKVNDIFQGAHNYVSMTILSVD